MKSIYELNNLMIELLDERNTTYKPLIFNSRGLEIIKEINDYAVTTAVYKSNLDKAEKLSDKNAEEIFNWMLNRIVNAPTTLHTYGSVMLLMPLLYERLQNNKVSQDELS